MNTPIDAAEQVARDILDKTWEYKRNRELEKCLESLFVAHGFYCSRYFHTMTECDCWVSKRRKLLSTTSKGIAGE